MEVQIMSVFVGVVFVILSYFINVKKELRFLRGYNQERIRDKKKFIELASAFYLVGGFILILVPIVFPAEWSIAAVQYVVLANLVLIIYVNVTMVDK
ncbi:exonuclease [Terribacillus sp. DMT04]|uniref:exonuclease n=1 Tax=Terribacillus sp. DMT04 TaxID=2850441 RepID=UPI001C2C5178|nr:exonuclease [Terribacillus sp. DMT04]QXE00576.1 exonuclease [Terribacillus sp. DMT04]